MKIIANVLELKVGKVETSKLQNSQRENLVLSDISIK